MADTASLVALARPRHWIKNVFVLMPLPFSVASGATVDWMSFLLGTLGFCFVNSAVYAFNDCHDAELDRQHADKKDRPVASGRVQPAEAWGLSIVLLLIGVALGWLADHPGVLAITVIYVLINVVYSLWSRSVALLDAFLLSSGYVLRVLLGCALIGVVASNWLLLCTSTLALFLALAKRRGDVVASVDHSHRPSLRGYNLSFLDQAIGITAGLAIMAYALYCMEADVLLEGREFATLPFVAFGVLEYLRVVHVKNQGGSPVDLVLTNVVLLMSGVGWVGATFWSLAF